MLVGFRHEMHLEVIDNQSINFFPVHFVIYMCSDMEAPSCEKYGSTASHSPGHLLSPHYYMFCSLWFASNIPNIGIIHPYIKGGCIYIWSGLCCLYPLIFYTRIVSPCLALTKTDVWRAVLNLLTLSVFCNKNNQESNAMNCTEPNRTEPNRYELNWSELN